MKVRYIFAFLAIFYCFQAKAGIYDQPTAAGAQWLAAQQNQDGSWGATQDIQPVYTSLAVKALYGAYKRQSAYFSGLTWLENHDNNNVDLISRQTDALASHGDDFSFSQTYLQSTQNLSGTTYSGWGLSSTYASSAIDTALALIAFADMGGNSVQTQPAINFLKNNQLSGANNQGWAVNGAVTSDAAITALVIQALSRYTSQDAALPTVISNGLTTLNALVSSATPTSIQALAAQAALDADNSTYSTTFLSMLTGSQATAGNAAGSWNADPYATALATRALATAANSASLSTLVTIPDQALRQAINLALGRNAMSSLSQGDLALLTSLTAVGAGISDLTGLQYATHLTSINVNNNNLSTIAPLTGLTQLPPSAISWIGNPGNPITSTSVPAMPEWGLIILGIGLFMISAYSRRFKPINQLINKEIS